MPNYFFVFFQYIYYLIRLPLLYLLRLISSLITKNKKIWIFGAREGKSFSGNSKYLFLYLQKFHNIRSIWISKNREVVEELKSKELAGHHAYSLSGIYFSLRAYVCFTTHGIYDINPYLTGRSIYINLLHVTFPIKQMEYNFSGYVPSKFITLFMLLIHKPFVFQKPDYIVSSSDWTARIFSSAYLVDKKNILKIGCLRSDRILDRFDDEDQLVLEILPDLNYTHMLFFFPTWRKDTDFDLFSYGFNENKVLDFLEKTNSILLVGLHPFDLNRYEQTSIAPNKRIVLINTKTTDTLPILKNSSVFITDYSSTFAGFLLLDRPIVFANFNHNAYVQERELYWNYDEITPGPKADSWDILLNHLTEILINKKDDYQKDRQMLREQIYRYRDGKSCSRLVDAVCKIING